MRARRFESCLGRSVRIGVGAVYRARLESVSLLMGTQVRILSNSSNNMHRWQSGLMRTAANREPLKGHKSSNLFRCVQIHGVLIQ